MSSSSGSGTPLLFDNRKHGGRKGNLDWRCSWPGGWPSRGKQASPRSRTRSTTLRGGGRTSAGDGDDTLLEGASPVEELFQHKALPGAVRDQIELFEHDGPDQRIGPAGLNNCGKDARPALNGDECIANHALLISPAVSESHGHIGSLGRRSRILASASAASSPRSFSTSSRSRARRMRGRETQTCQACTAASAMSIRKNPP